MNDVIIEIPTSEKRGCIACLCECINCLFEQNKKTGTILYNIPFVLIMESQDVAE